MEKVARFISLKTSGNSWIGIKFSIFNFQFSIKLIFVILFIAAFLRLYRIQDYMTFLGDEGRDVLVVYNILHGNLTLLGPTASVGGFFLGPIYYYFMAPFLWLFDYNPVGPAIMVALFGIATVWLIYKVGNDFFGYGTGLIAAFLYSISPLAIAYSRSSWNPNLMPFFSLLTLYILYKAIKESKIKLFIFCGFLLGIAMQLHYLSIFLGIIIGFYILFIRLKESGPVKAIKDYFYVLLGFLIGWLPFLAFEVRHDFPNIRSIINFVLRGQETGGNSQFFTIIENVFFRLFGRLVTNFPPPEQVSLQAHTPIALWYYATLVLGIGSVTLLVYKFIKNFKDKDQFQRISLFVIWLLIGVGLFGFYKKSIYDYYFGFMFPLPFMLASVTIVGIYTNTHEYVRYIGGSLSKSLLNRGQHEWTRIRWMGKVLAVGIFLLLTWVNLQGVPFRYIPNRQLEQVEKIARFVYDKSEGKPYNFALITGGNSDHAYRYFLTVWDKPPVTIENPKEDPKRTTVTGQLLVICEKHPCAPLGNSLWEIAGFGRAEIVNEWDVSVVKVYKLQHYSGNE
jgi:4-amino-4-deoxy-L-arabinose transferase-like glycosyltransferase